MDEMVDLFCELRKSKGVTPEQARGIHSQANYFGTMLVKMGIADALLGGATYSTADTVPPPVCVHHNPFLHAFFFSCLFMMLLIPVPPANSFLINSNDNMPPGKA